jgi:hypothetical protein
MYVRRQYIVVNRRDRWEGLACRHVGFGISTIREIFDKLPADIPWPEWPSNTS